MHRRRPIRLLLREHGICSGTETVNLHLVEEFIQLVERVVWVMPSARMKFFQQFFPPSDRLVYELPFWPARARLAHLLRKATSLALRQKRLPARFAFQKMRQELSDLWFRRLIRQHHITHCFYNWTYCVDVPRTKVPIGAMLMDVRWKRFPDTLAQIDINLLDDQFSEWLRKSSIVFPISETTASDIRQFYPWHTGEMRVVPHGAARVSHNQPGSMAANGNQDGRCLFFCPAAANEHKNHITLFRACAELFTRGFDFDVVLTGFGTNYFAQDKLNGQCSPNGDIAVKQARAFLNKHHDLFKGRIKPLGYIDRAQVDALYNECSAVVLPSFFEGFGLALIEALQNGATIICSDIPAHREQLMRYDCFDQIALIPPMDPSSLAAEMEKILIESAAGRVKKRVPPNTLKRWTWRDAAEAYLDSLAGVTPRDNGKMPSHK